jgi:hypothetical protein
MWWEAQNEHEVLVASAVTELKGWFANLISEETYPPAQTPPVVLGFGSVRVESEAFELYPFILINSNRYKRYNPEPFRLLPAHVVEGLLVDLLRLRSPPPFRMRTYGMCVTPPQASSNDLTFAEQMSLVEGVINDFVQVREPIIENPQGARGTAAILVHDRRTNRPGLLTAGHIFSGSIGSRVDKVRKYFLFERREPIGVLTHHQTPVQGQAGWDVAVVQLSDHIHPRGRLVGRGVESFDRPEPVVVHGAVTGYVSQAVVQGVLVEIAYGEQNRRWKNCWMMAPSGVLRSGDSGSAVFTREDRRFLGMYMGSSYLPGSGQALFHYVQDARTLDAEVLQNWQIELFR